MDTPKCLICLEPYEETKSVRCTGSPELHLVHLKCQSKWLSDRCVVCGSFVEGLPENVSGWFKVTSELLQTPAEVVKAILSLLRDEDDDDDDDDDEEKNGSPEPIPIATSRMCDNVETRR